MKLTKTRSRMLMCSVSLLLAPVALANADEKFSKMDADGNGQISLEEHANGARQMFTEIDTNKDGVVTATEMEAKMYSKDRGRGEMSARDKIREVDKNSDGRLTRDEHLAGVDTMFGKMDSNQDGSLSREELEAGHKKMMHKRDS